jgi:hypothetical protein
MPSKLEQQTQRMKLAAYRREREEAVEKAKAAEAAKKKQEGSKE